MSERLGRFPDAGPLYGLSVNRFSRSEGFYDHRHVLSLREATGESRVPERGELSIRIHETGGRAWSAWRVLHRGGDEILALSTLFSSVPN